MKRRQFLKAATAGVSLPLLNILVPQARAARLDRPMNLVVFLTDQERSVQHFPAGWARDNLSCTNRLQSQGLTFNNAFCCAAMCSPSRATLFTGLFPAQHQVTDTLELDMSYETQQLPFNVTNLAHVMGAAGYEVVYKGKWHLSLPPTGEAGDHPSAALRPYEFRRWNPPDAGANQSLDEYGGGDAANDRRFVFGRNADVENQEGAVEYIRRASQSDQPFCLIVSLVNPHDVLGYPNNYLAGGYTEEWLRGDIELPATYREDLSTKPRAQRGQIPLLNAGLGELTSDQEGRNYLNFYANLMRYADRQLLAVYQELERQGLLDDTLIVRTSDHGEMGLTHGGLRQKNFNVYEETLRVPLVFSNPKLFPRRFESNAPVSHVDFVPTIASLFNSSVSESAWQGVDYSHLITRRGTGLPPQAYTVFTFDDIHTGQDLPATAPPPNHIISIREGRYKIARYYDPDGRFADEWEMYDLHLDPLEVRNLANPNVRTTAVQRIELRRLMNRLEKVTEQRLQPLKRRLIPEPRIYSSDGVS
jgi:arylsulfatase A-like enzyme